MSFLNGRLVLVQLINLRNEASLALVQLINLRNEASQALVHLSLALVLFFLRHIFRPIFDHSIFSFRFNSNRQINLFFFKRSAFENEKRLTFLVNYGYTCISLELYFQVFVYMITTLIKGNIFPYSLTWFIVRWTPMHWRECIHPWCFIIPIFLFIIWHQ